MPRRAVLALCLPLVLGAQQPASRDSARTRSDSTRTRRDTLEAVVVMAVRATLAAPAAQHTVTRDAISRSFAGEDAPLFLTRTPSMTSYSESGGFSGYSYLRLRGIDQTRLNISIDGVPLNDPEDQVLYFSNVPDFLGSIESVQIQRGVGASGFGTASYAGSLNFQSVPIATAARGGALRLAGGSFGTAGASAEYATGIRPGAWAAYGRLSAQRTDGFRRHSGNDARSGFFSGGWFGNRDALKFSGFAGISGTRMAYLAASEADLAKDRRINPLSDAEGDRFHQEMASLQWTHAVTDASRFTLTGYRNSAAGAFDVAWGDDMFNYALAHVWYGLVSAYSLRAGPFSLDAGMHVSDYHREHAMAVRPLLTQRAYSNVGYKQEQSGFSKLAYDVGSVRLSADLQVRRAAFRYQPSANAGIAGASTSWTFVNPKVGVTWHPAGRSSALALYATYGRNSREPARGDLFAGADDVNGDNVASIFPLTKVRPERVDDFEAGANWSSGTFSVSGNVFDMEFHDEIAAIGELSLTGNPLRKNVGRSYRRGVELDATWRASSRVTAAANLTAMQSRIKAYFDAPSGKTYLDVEPLQTPPVVANAQVDVRITGSLSLLASGRHVARAHLANDGNPGLVIPRYSLADASLTWHGARVEIRGQLSNVFDVDANTGGYTDGSSRYFYPIAGRGVMIVTRLEF